MTGKVIGSFTKRYSEMLLYFVLIATLLSHRLLDFPDFSIVVLLSPLVFLENIFRWKNPWNLFILTFPICLLLGFDIKTLLNAFLSALAEEVFFRAYLMRRYGNITVSAMFALPHFLIYQNFVSLLTFFPSLLFGFLYKKTDSLIFVSLVHLYSNLLYNAWIIRLV